jgi:hypothetical protein
MAERGSKLKYLLKEHGILEQLIIECGGEVPLRKEEVCFPAMRNSSENVPYDAQEAERSASERRIEHERKIKQLENYYSQLFKLRKKLSMLISMDEKGISSSEISRTFAREKSI